MLKIKSALWHSPTIDMLYIQAVTFVVQTAQAQTKTYFCWVSYPKECWHASTSSYWSPFNSQRLKIDTFYLFTVTQPVCQNGLKAVSQKEHTDIIIVIIIITVIVIILFFFWMVLDCHVDHLVTTNAQPPRWCSFQVRMAILVIILCYNLCSAWKGVKLQYNQSHNLHSV